jgi:hypothetical protein
VSEPLPAAVRRDTLGRRSGRFLPRQDRSHRHAQLDIDPISGEDVTRLIGELFTMPPAVLTKLKELLR